MAQYAYPGNNNEQYKPPSGNRRKYQGCTPARGGKKKVLEWALFYLFALDVLCQFMTQLVKAGFIFWWIGLGDDVLIFMLLMFLISR